MRWEGKIKIFPEIVPEMNVYVFLGIASAKLHSLCIWNVAKKLPYNIYHYIFISFSIKDTSFAEWMSNKFMEKYYQSFLWHGV